MSFVEGIPFDPNQKIMKHKKAIICFLGSIGLVGVTSPSAFGDLKHRYSFDETGGTVATDSISGANGTVVNNTGLAGFQSGRLYIGNTGAETSNSGTGNYVDLPNGLISDLVGTDGSTAFTLEAWFTWDTATDWQRIWDIGTSVGGEDVSDSGDATAQIFATPQAGGGGARVAWRGQGLGEASLTRQPSLPTGEEQHLVFVWDESDTSARFYLNGTLVGQNTATAITIADNYAGNDVNVWLGRSQWNDTMFVGSYNEFRVWDSALSPLDIAENYIGGADTPEGGDLGNVVSLTATLGASSIILEESTTMAVLADFDQFTGLNVGPLSAFSSDNEAVATVNAAGVVTGISEGSAVITAEYNGATATAEINVQIPPLPVATLAHRYDFSDAVGSTTLSDLVGSADGEAINIQFDGNGLAFFNGTNQSYVNLPNGIISSKQNVTVEAWVTYDPSGGAWQRLFDFGTTSLGEDPDPSGAGYSGAESFFFAPRQGAIGGANGGRFAFDSGGGENPQINPSADVAAPIGEQFHMVGIYNYAQRSASIWINGAQIGQAPVLAERPLSELNDVNNWLGRSQWSGDAFATADFNEFRIYEGVLTPVQIAVNNSVGPDNFIDDPGAMQSLSMSAGSSTLVAGALPVAVNLIADFDSVASVNVSAFPGSEVTSSDASVVQILTNPLRLYAVGAGTAEINGSLDGLNATPLTVTVTAAAAPVLENRYSFDGSADDSVGTLNGTLFGTGSIGNGEANFDGASFIDLPDFLFSDYYFQVEENPAVSFELFGTWNGGGAWQRMIDFGSNNMDVQGPDVGPDAYGAIDTVFLTPSSGGGLLQFTFNNGQGTDVFMTGQALVAGEPFHVVVVFDPANGVMRLYRNGVLQSIATVPTDALFAINDVNVWLGRSNYSGDAFYNGTLSEVRVWRGALSDAAIAKQAVCGPDQLDCEVVTDVPPLAISQSNGSVTLSWNSNAASIVLESTATLNGEIIWTAVDVTPTVDAGMSSVTLTPAGNQFFRLRSGN
jgi:hypothetical protein